jgi:hypothetical protein
MLKKGQTTVKFTRPASAMRVVLSAVEAGNHAKHEIATYTKLDAGKVKSALLNLCFIGAVVRTSDELGRSVYHTPGQYRGTAQCLKGVRSIFDVRI